MSNLIYCNNFLKRVLIATFVDIQETVFLLSTHIGQIRLRSSLGQE